MSSTDIELKIKKFDIKTIENNATICIIGKRRTGKSVLVKDIMYNFRHISKGTVFSAAQNCDLLLEFISDKHICQEYDPSALEEIFKHQDEIIKKDKGKSPENNTYCIMDDMLSFSGMCKKDSQIRNLLLNNRCRNMLVLLTLQHSMGIELVLRAHLDYIFIFHESSLEERKQLWEKFAGVIPKFDIFQNIMDLYTKDFSCLVIKNNSFSNRLEDLVFWYKAECTVELQEDRSSYTKL